MSERLLWLLVILLSSFAQLESSDCNHFLNGLERLVQSKEYEQAIQQAKQLQYCYQLEKDWEGSTRLYFKCAFWASQNNDLEQFYTASDSAQLLYNTHSLEFDDEEMIEIWNNLIEFYSYLGDYKQSISYCEQVLDADLRWLYLDKEAALYVGSDYQNIAMLYRKQGEYQKAIANYQKALSYFESESFDAAITLGNIAYDYHQKGDVEQAKYYYLESIELEDKLLQQFGNQEDIRRDWIRIQHNYATFLNKAAVYDEAITQLRLTQDWIAPTDTLVWSNYYTILGGSFAKQGQFQAAEQHWQRALYMRQSLSNVPITFLSDSYYDIGQYLYVAQGDFEQATLYFDQALSSLYSGLNIKNLPPPSTLPIDKLRFLKILKAYAATLVTMNQTHQANELYVYLLDLIDYLRLHHSRLSAKFHLVEEVLPIYEAAMQVALAQQQTERAFQIAERSKATILLEQIERQAAHQFLPDNLAKQEARQQQQIVLYERLLAESKTQKERANYQQHLFDLHQSHDDFLEQLARDYPDYFTWQYGWQQSNIKAIQSELLDDKTALLEYVEGEEQIYLFVLTRNNIKNYIFPKNADYQLIINEFRSVISTPSTDVTSFDLYTKTAFQIYQQFVATALLDGIDRLIIVPDGSLHYVPFQVLLSRKVSDEETGRYDRLPYLMRAYSISYAPSLTLLWKLHQQEKKGIQMGSFAPVFEQAAPIAMRSTAAALPHSRLEVKQISTAFASKIFMDTAANIAQFKATLSDWDILHIATHATVNDTLSAQSQIYFYDDYLTLNEIYHLPLQARLVVLSACATGVGKLQRGEGLLSLSRAFLLAGSESLVTSLWQVNDQSTADLMTHFYTALADGQTKDSALRLAQLDYLSQADFAAKKHPFYWAAFTQIGRSDALVERSVFYHKVLWFSLLSIFFAIGLTTYSFRCFEEA
ncbi:MAG: CHAT domain-containing protein [Bacteroidota bacterium]